MNLSKRIGLTILFIVAALAIGRIVYVKLLYVSPFDESLALAEEARQHHFNLDYSMAINKYHDALHNFPFNDKLYNHDKYYERETNILDLKNCRTLRYNK
jgi:hypothetical protein